MKKFIHAKQLDAVEFEVAEIVSLVLVEDVRLYDPRDRFIEASSNGSNLDYTTLTREQLLQLPKKELQRMHNVAVLRKLHKDELTPMQQREVTQANMQKHQISRKEVQHILDELKKRPKVFVWDTEKNESFFNQIAELGGDVSDIDARNIIRKLELKDYSYSTYSYLDRNWNSALIVFEYKGEFTFKGIEDENSPVTIKDLDIYIKIDVDSISKRGYAAMSFHNPEFVLPHPYAKH